MDYPRPLATKRPVLCARPSEAASTLARAAAALVPVIDPEQLAAALERLDPRDRELLALSLRRRVPDDALADMYAVEAPEIARRRAGAIDRLADELGIRRGEELGAVLRALLEDETWSATGAPPGAEFATDRAPAPVVHVPSDPGLERLVRSEEPPASPAKPEPPPEPQPPAEPQPLPEAPSEPRRRTPHLAIALFGTGVAALLAALGLIGATQLGGGGEAAAGGSGPGDGTRHFVPEDSGPAAAPFPSEPQALACYPTAQARGPVTLFRSPGGRRLARLRGETEWSSPRVFGVTSREGDWLAVQAPELPNGAVGWLRAQDARLDCTIWSMHADLSERRLVVRRNGQDVRAFDTAIGRRGNNTPEGRFSVTDKLRVSDRNSPYGCCVLALTGHQTRLPESWPGGDRLAVHSTRDEASIGRAVTLGCLRVTRKQAKWLIETIPLGAPIFISS